MNAVKSLLPPVTVARNSVHYGTGQFEDGAIPVIFVSLSSGLALFITPVRRFTVPAGVLRPRVYVPFGSGHGDLLIGSGETPDGCDRARAGDAFALLTALRACS